eukprot:5939963-Alexandrium_andersonii.AAC.1
MSSAPWPWPREYSTGSSAWATRCRNMRCTALDTARRKKFPSATGRTLPGASGRSCATTRAEWNARSTANGTRPNATRRNMTTCGCQASTK